LATESNWSHVEMSQRRQPWALAGPATLFLALAAALPAMGQAATDIHVLPLARDGGRILLAGPPVRVTDRDGYDNQPMFTPDGGAILYTSIRVDQADTYRYDIASGRTLAMTDTPESEYSPTPVPGSDRFSVVRVEGDGTQRLWSFAADGSDPRLVLPDIAPVGYHAWVSDGSLALFVLGQPAEGRPATLQLARPGPGLGRVAATDIGRAIQPVPGRSAVTFTQEIDGEWWLRELDTRDGQARTIVQLLEPDGYHAHTWDGAVLAASGSQLWQLDPQAGWVAIADLAPFEIHGLSRLAVSPDGGLLAVVAERHARETTPGGDATLAAAFADHGATGTMVIRRLSDGREWVHHPARADSTYLPASTFKIPNAAIGLETGVVTGPDEEFPWDGVERQFAGWNRDHTFQSAMTASAVHVFQEVARRVGEPRMTRWLERIGYGNASTDGGIDRFWLAGGLRISAREQVSFLERFVTGRTPFAPETVAAVTDMVLVERGEGWALHAKTGWAFEVQLGWWAGWTERDGETWVFALNIDMPDSRADPPKRLSIGLSALEAVGALPGTR
jgi:beta-lactamase class D